MPSRLRIGWVAGLLPVVAAAQNITQDHDLWFLCGAAAAVLPQTATLTLNNVGTPCFSPPRARTCSRGWWSARTWTSPWRKSATAQRRSQPPSFYSARAVQSY